MAGCCGFKSYEVFNRNEQINRPKAGCYKRDEGSCKLLKERPYVGNCCRQPFYRSPVGGACLEKACKELVSRPLGGMDKNIYVEGMTAGYAGHIPRYTENFGAPFSKTVNRSLCEFETRQQDERCRREALSAVVRVQSGRPTVAPVCADNMLDSSQNRLPLKPIQADMDPYYVDRTGPVRKNFWELANDDTEKYRMSGYDGHVPRDAEFLGVNQPGTSHQGMNLATNERIWNCERKTRPVCLDPKTALRRPSVEVYPVRSGMIPGYAGHVPGEQFRTGMPWGTSTINSLGVCTKYPLARRPQYEPCNPGPCGGF